MNVGFRRSLAEGTTLRRDHIPRELDALSINQPLIHHVQPSAKPFWQVEEHLIVVVEFERRQRLDACQSDLLRDVLLLLFRQVDT